MRSSSSEVPPNQDSKRQQLLSAQIGLLCANANLGIGVTILAATILGALQWGIVPRLAVIGWWFYMTLVSVLRYVLAMRYRQVTPGCSNTGKWLLAFAVSIGLAGAGWGGAGVLLYPAAHLMNQVFLLFVLGGMMLGAASLLAPRPEAFLAFLLPAGLVPAVRLFVQGDETHLAMGLLATAFTIATLITTGRIYRTVDSSLRLQIENRNLVSDLQTANQETEALNQALELRVQERTAELHETAEQLRAEIAQREHAEEELLRARKLESLGVLAGGIAHDFNNFLTVVQGNIGLVKSHLNPGEPAQQYLDQAANACKRAAFLSSQLLTFAKGGTPVRRLVSIAELVTDAVELAASGSSIKVAVDVAADLWWALVDPGQIGQVLHNILLNARQAMPSGGTVEVRGENIVSLDSTDSAGPRVRLSIRDYGCGISAEVLPRIFDPYFTTKPDGNGLGLATAYAIVAKHGGHIGVESKLGAGTVFTVDLPASRETSPPPPAHVARVETGTERLLLMDDEEALRILFKAVLTHLGYEVETASDGDEAIALYARAKASERGFAAVVLDLTVIGGMGGMETAARLKQLDPSSKLIVSSGYSDAPIMSDFAEYGFDAVILKPWTVIDISEVLRKVLVVGPLPKTE
jgi:signal transduction histidine kinase/ActR/RegA family two-component response regulator